MIYPSDLSMCSYADYFAHLCSVYLRRLIHLHVDRVDALKRILLTLPARHSRDSLTPCDGTESSVFRAWALATAYLAWEAQPDLSTVKLAQILAPLLDHV